jgi:hypothetical protein
MGQHAAPAWALFSTMGKDAAGFAPMGETGLFLLSVKTPLRPPLRLFLGIKTPLSGVKAG